MTAQRTTPPSRLLVIDDDHRYGKWLGHHLGVLCPDSTVSTLTHTEFESWCETEPGRENDILLLTACFGSSPEDPKARGLEQLRRLRMRAVFPAVICLAEEGNELTAVRALQLGAVDYLPKRLLTPERLSTSVRLALRRLEKRALRKAIAGTTHVTEAPASEDDTTREQPKVNGAPLPLKESPRNQAAVDFDADEAHGRSIIEALLDPKAEVELVTPAALGGAVPSGTAAASKPGGVSASGTGGAGVSGAVAPASGTSTQPHGATLSAGGLAAAAAMSHTSTHAPISKAAGLAPAASLAGATLGGGAPGTAAPASSAVAGSSVGASALAAAMSHTSTHAPIPSAAAPAPSAADATSRASTRHTSAPQTSTTHATAGQAPGAQPPAAAEASSADSALSGLFAAHLAKAAAAPGYGTSTRAQGSAAAHGAASRARESTATSSGASARTQESASAAYGASARAQESAAGAASDADEANTNATQLMAPGALAAALDEAAASALVEGVRPTDSGVLGTNTLTPGKSSRSRSKRGDSSAPPVTAEFIPGYIIKMKIGESEKAVVYLATSISLGSNVALKVSKTLRDDAAGRQFLEREYTAIIAIRDPLVVQIYDYGVHAGFEYLAMEYLLRGDLKARMQAGLKEAEALRYVEQIACALRVVHNAGLLHRDLKPPNVMLRENDEVALIDFGLARALDGSTPSTRTGVLRGSPYYMSPEQAQGELLDERSDFYSLGIILYEMLTGRKPYTGATAMEVLQQHVNSPLPPLPHSLARYEHILHRLSAKNRAERFDRADEIIAAIQEIRAAITLNVESAVA